MILPFKRAARDIGWCDAPTRSCCRRVPEALTSALERSMLAGVHARPTSLEDGRYENPRSRSCPVSPTGKLGGRVSGGVGSFVALVLRDSGAGRSVGRTGRGTADSSTIVEEQMPKKLRPTGGLRRRKEATIKRIRCPIGVPIGFDSL